MKRIKSRTQLKVELAALKNHPCMDCISSGRDGIWPVECMQFDHRDPEQKISKVGLFVLHGDVEGFYAEVEKCDLVCANCHAIRTKSRGISEKQRENMRKAQQQRYVREAKANSQSKSMKKYHDKRREAGLEWMAPR